MKFSIAPGLHIWDMDVANAALRFGVDGLAIAFHPFTIAGCALIGEGGHGDDAHLFALHRLDRQLYLTVGLVHQQFLWAAFRPHALSIDGQNGIAFGYIQPWRGEW